ncbi:quercetin dioxygenase-like cupin family protein [Raoultella sp. BIGb0138]|uniref:cupin domain-containing protein n=1 Tax=Raoultella sp. BIGb0138 TaxID=2485115 RepID=UPI001048A89A|nr:cupin domain-containing protein [Raoultella sp. BIGb0138]TCW17618.1 quercetin dioxygenase-like cupin family protein [Raoultella sp. BIGb0138]
MRIFHGREANLPSEKRGATFTGEVWADVVMPATDGITINNVFFTPGARTFWHTHEQGQILQVIAGKGWICVAGESAQPIRAGDTVWIPAGERHWHGAAQDSYMQHTATSLGKTGWQDEVTHDQYEQSTRG